MSRTTPSMLAALLSLSIGPSMIACVGDPDLGTVSDAIRSRAPIERLAWEAAPAGCEDVPTLAARIHLCLGEPMLGALVEPSGRVLCVDAISALQDQGVHGEVEVEVNWDPTPTPITPSPELEFAEDDEPDPGS